MPEATEVGAGAPPADQTPPAGVAEDQKAPPPDAAEATADVEQETTEQQEQRKQSKFQRRLDRQKTARIQAETERDLLRQRLADLEAQRNQQPKDEGEPKREAFDDYEAYLRAVAKYEAKQVSAAEAKAEREARAKETKQQPDAAAVERAKSWDKREKTFEATTKDYVEVVTPFLDDELQSFSQQARLAIVESDVGPGLLYHLATHPEEADRIAALSPVRQIAELGKLETKVSAAPKKTTNAPAPITPVNGGKTNSKDIAKMSMDEYTALRKSQGARWAR